MKNPFRIKTPLPRLILAALLPVVVQTASAQVFLTDNFTVDANSNDPNFEIGNGRQGGTAATSTYTAYETPGNLWNHQVGSTTSVGAPDSNFLLLAENGAVQNALNVSTSATGPLSISFTLYNRGSHTGELPSYWGAFTLQAAGTYPFPVVNSGEFGILNREGGGVQVFDGTGGITPAGWDTTGFATNTQWTFIFTDTAGTGSAFAGNGSQVTIINGVHTLGTLTVAQLNGSNLGFGFRADSEGDPANLLLIGIDNLAVASSVAPALLPVGVQDISPSSDTVAVGSNVVFTAAFSNSPPVSLQWLQIASGPVTNNIHTGVVNVTNNGVVTSTLTLNNVQVASAGTYQLEAVNATNSAAVAYTSTASLTVAPTITWYAPGTYNSSFSDNTVFGLAGSVANEVYGVDFGGSGALTTANGYSFDDYSSGNMNVNGSGFLDFGGFLGSATSGDGNFDIILNNGIQGSAANTATLNNLTVGQSYTVLVVLDDTRTSGATGPNFNVTDGLTTSPSQRFAFPNGTPAIGGFIMGTFTAQATTQPLTVLQNGNSQYVAVLLEKGIAPPPVTPPALATDIHPLTSVVAIGAPITLSVAATGSQPIHYQWFSESGAISGQTNTSYSFDAESGTNTYYVAVSNSVSGIVSSTATVISAANIVTVNNYSFENGFTGSGNFIFPVSWTPFNNNSFSDVVSADYTPTDPLPAPADGDYYYQINEGPGNPTGGLYQDVGPLLPNTVYTLTVATGLRQDFTPGSLGSPGIISLLNGTDNTGTLLASTSGIPSTPNTWQDNTVSYTNGPTASGDLIVELSVAGANTYQANFDNVRLTTSAAPSVIPPSLTTDIHPLRSEVTTGSPVTLSVVASGTPTLNYQWSNQNGPINGATGASYTFNAVSGTSSYFVAVSNTAAAIVSSTAVVISAPNLITVTNFSFENGTKTGTGGQTIPVGWSDFNDANFSTVADNSYSVTNPLAGPADGNDFFAINEGPTDPTGGIYQDVGPLQPYTAYTLTVATGRRMDFPNPPGALGTPGIISLINGVNNTGTLLATTSGIPATADSWQNNSVTFTTGGSVSGDLTIELSAAGASTFQANFDNVRLTRAAVFESAPPTISGGNLILTGGGGTAGAGYSVLSTTNLTSPINWITNTTGTLSGTGTFSNSIPVGTAPAEFFRVRMP